MMKKLSKILLVMAMSLVLIFAMMTAASAASIADVSASVGSDDGRTVTVTVVYSDPTAAQQSTVLVVKDGVQLATLTDADIKYIDQETVDGTTVTYEFKLLEADRTGTYLVYVGGTDVDAPSNTTISFDTRNIIGTFTVFGDAAKATVVATPVGGSDGISGKVTATAEGKGSYVIEVTQGTYDVVLGKAGYLYKTYAGREVGQDEVNLGDITLIPGDFADYGLIDLSDLQPVLTNFGTANANLDVNDDGKTDLTELQAVLTNFGVTGYTE